MTPFTSEERWGIALVCVVAGTAVLMFCWPLINPLMADKDAPAWVQAIGSVLAIIVSAALVLWQHHLELSRAAAAAHEAEHSRLVSVTEVVLAAADTIKKLAMFSAKPPAKPTEEDDLEVVSLMGELRSQLQTIQETDLASVADGPTIRCLIQTRATLQQLLHQADDLENLLTPAAGSHLFKKPFKRAEVIFLRNHCPAVLAARSRAAGRKADAALPSSVE